MGGRARPWDQLDKALGGRRHRDLRDRRARTGPDARRASRRPCGRRRDRPLFLIDIAVPRDVEPEVGNLDQVFLYNIDDLRSIVQENLARRSAELERAEAIVRDEVERFGSWMQSREIIPTVVALRQRFETIRKSELQRLEPKLVGPAARRAGACRRDHAPYRREAAADPDRTAQVGQ